MTELPLAVYKRMRAKMQLVPLNLRAILHERNVPIKHVYFVASGWVSLVATFDDGFPAEVGIIGFEGMVGLPLFNGVTTEIADAVVQGQGAALRMAAADFIQEVDTSAELRREMLRYSEALRSQSMQSAACNGHHSLEQRLARWLLAVRDRSRSDELPVTQELLAMMLCVHRPSVTVAAGRLQRAGLIRYSAGQLTIIDRTGLEAVSCECYGIVRERYRTLME